MAQSKTVFDTLNAINVNDRTETKNNLTYLSWAWAWQTVKENYPTATYTIYENEGGMFYHSDGKSAWVKTGVTIEGIEHIEYLPVMDFRNASIQIEKINSTDVNKSIQRSLTKAIARHGLGLYVYAGEDLPQNEVVALAEEKAKAEKERKTAALLTLKKGDKNWDNIINYVTANKSQGVDKLTEMVGKKYKVTATVIREITEIVNAKCEIQS
tara:strand:- start:3147 stop:3782 length:636 start_codon:yes stop_codon:yes gene_type:complete